MSRPANVRNPFDWKRTMVEDLAAVDAITERQRAALQHMIDTDEAQDRIQGQRELDSRRTRRAELPWWKRLLS